MNIQIIIIIIFIIIVLYLLIRLISLNKKVDKKENDIKDLYKEIELRNDTIHQLNCRVNSLSIGMNNFNERIKIINKYKRFISNITNHIFNNKHNLYTVPEKGLYLKYINDKDVAMFTTKTSKDTLNYMPCVKFDDINFQTKEELLEYYNITLEDLKAE